MRWLQLHGRHEIARKQLEKVAHLNGKEMPSKDFKICENRAKTGSFKHLFSNWKLVKITLINWNIWCVYAAVLLCNNILSVKA